MTEIKTYQKTEGLTFTIVGGKRDTTYDNFNQAVRRIKNLYKNGRRITVFYIEGKHVNIWMHGNANEPIVSETPGYQRVRFGKDTICQYNKYTGYLWSVKPAIRKI